MQHLDLHWQQESEVNVKMLGLRMKTVAWALWLNEVAKSNSERELLFIDLFGTRWTFLKPTTGKCMSPLRKTRDKRVVAGGFCRRPWLFPVSLACTHQELKPILHHLECGMALWFVWMGKMWYKWCLTSSGLRLPEAHQLQSVSGESWLPGMKNPVVMKPSEVSQPHGQAVSLQRGKGRRLRPSAQSVDVGNSRMRILWRCVEQKNYPSRF